MRFASTNQPGAQDYQAFGRRVRSDRPIPFEQAAEPSNEEPPEKQPLTLVEHAQLASKIDRAHLTCFHDAEDFPGGPTLSVYRAAAGFVVEHDDFLLRFDPEASRIEYRLSFETNEEFRFGLMVERVAIPLFLLLTEQNILGIHGGAVTLGERAWVFIGPSGVGKSTTARKLLEHGARLMTDDLALLDADSATVLPGCPAVRLWEGEGAVEQAVHDTQLTEQIPKRWFRIDSRYLEPDPSALAAIVVLDPQPVDDAALAPTFDQLKGQEAFAAVMRQVFNFSDPEPTFATRQFRNVKALLAANRVIRYRYQRSKSGRPTHVDPLLDYLGSSF